MPRLRLDPLEGKAVPSSGLTPPASPSDTHIVSVMPVDSTGNPLPPRPDPRGPQSGPAPAPPPRLDPPPGRVA